MGLQIVRAERLQFKFRAAHYGILYAISAHKDLFEKTS
jgi:hypothetical protein